MHFAPPAARSGCICCMTISPCQACTPYMLRMLWCCCLTETITHSNMSTKQATAFPLHKSLDSVLTWRLNFELLCGLLHTHLISCTWKRQLLLFRVSLLFVNHTALTAEVASRGCQFCDRCGLQWSGLPFRACDTYVAPRDANSRQRFSDSS